MRVQLIKRKGGNPPSILDQNITSLTVAVECLRAWDAGCIAGPMLVVSTLEKSSIYMFFLHSLNSSPIVLFSLGNPWECFSRRFYDVRLITSSFPMPKSYWERFSDGCHANKWFFRLLENHWYLFGPISMVTSCNVTRYYDDQLFRPCWLSVAMAISCYVKRLLRRLVIPTMMIIGCHDDRLLRRSVATATSYSNYVDYPLSWRPVVTSVAAMTSYY